MTRVLVAIPCYNCCEQIQRVLIGFDNLLLARVEEVILVDNQSSDGTLASAMKFLDQFPQSKIKLYRNKMNYGLGGTFKLVMSYAKKNSFDSVIFLHGDAQAETDEVSLFLDGLEKDPECAAFLGARFMPQSRLVGYSKLREFGNRGLNLLFTLLTFKRVYDIGSGLNAYNMHRIDLAEMEKLPDHLAFDVSLLLYYIERKYKIRFLPITWKEEDQISNAKNIDTGIRVLSLLIRWRLGIKRSVPVRKLSDLQFEQI